MDLLAAEDTYRKLHAIGNAAIAGLREVFRRCHMKAIVQGFGPMFQIYLRSVTSFTITATTAGTWMRNSIRALCTGCSTVEST